MRICFWHSDKPRESLLADAFLDGLDNRDEGFKRPLGADFGGDFDVACMVGVKSRKLMQRCWKLGIHTIYFDKGYLRHSAMGPVKIWQFWRVAVDAHHPTEFLSKARCKGDRFGNLCLDIQPWREFGEHIVIAGSSQKYHDFYGLFDPTRYAHKLVKDIRGYSDREIIYRPKPSWHDAEPIEGTVYSDGKQTIHDVLKNAHVLVTHGSNSCFEAILGGIPCIILGDGPAKPISSNDIGEIESPYMATDQERYQWFSNLAYCQWSLREMANGRMWETVRPQVYG